MEYERGVADKDYPSPNPPFMLNPLDGTIRTTNEITGDVKTWRFAVEAKDNPGQASDQNSIDAEVIVSEQLDYDLVSHSAHSPYCHINT